MRRLFLIVLAFLAVTVSLSGCGRTIGGPRFWWDDRNQVRLDDYELPYDPGAADDYGTERRAMASGEDLSEDDLRDFHTNLDQEEEKKKSESSLLDF